MTQYLVAILHGCNNNNKCVLITMDYFLSFSCVLVPSKKRPPGQHHSVNHRVKEEKADAIKLTWWCVNCFDDGMGLLFEQIRSFDQKLLWRIKENGLNSSVWVYYIMRLKFATKKFITFTSR